MTPLGWTHVALLALILMVVPVYAIHRIDANKNKSAPLRGLNLPRGSVRSMLALLVVSSLLLTVVFGKKPLGDGYNQAISILGTLGGSILGFYFGSREKGLALAQLMAELQEPAPPGTRKAPTVTPPGDEAGPSGDDDGSTGSPQA